MSGVEIPSRNFSSSVAKSGPCSEDVIIAPHPRAPGARPSGRFTVLYFPALGKILDASHILPTVPSGGSPDGTGESPVLPMANTCACLHATSCSTDARAHPPTNSAIQRGRDFELTNRLRGEKLTPVRQFAGFVVSLMTIRARLLA